MGFRVTEESALVDLKLPDVTQEQILRSSGLIGDAEELGPTDGMNFQELIRSSGQVVKISCDGGDSFRLARLWKTPVYVVDQIAIKYQVEGEEGIAGCGHIEKEHIDSGQTVVRLVPFEESQDLNFSNFELSYHPEFFTQHPEVAERIRKRLEQRAN